MEHLLLVGLQLVTRVVTTRVVVIRTTRVTSTTRAVKEGTTIRWEEGPMELEQGVRVPQPLT